MTHHGNMHEIMLGTNENCIFKETKRQMRIWSDITARSSEIWSRGGLFVRKGKIDNRRSTTETLSLPR